MEQVEQNFNKILDKNPFLKSVLLKLNNSGIKYGLYAGTQVSILTSNRMPTDIDFLVADEDILKLKEIFPFALTKDCGDSLFLYIGRNEEIEFMSQDNINIDGSNYTFRLTDLCWKNTTLLKGKDFEFRLCNVVDTILLKSILQRGKEQGKHDLEDIEALMKVCEIDKKYLEQRLLEIKGDQRVIDILKKFDII